MRTIVAFLSLISWNLNLVAQTFTHSDQQWIHYFAQIKLNEKASLGYDAGFRWKEILSEPSQMIGRVSFGYMAYKNLSVGGGFAISSNFTDAVISSVELRPYQELNLSFKKKKSVTQFRYRLEERLFTDYSNHEASTHRFILRNRFSFSFSFFLVKPFKKFDNTSLWFFVGDEYFMNLTNAENVSWFDQNRIIAGPVIKFNDKLSLQLLYNMQIAPGLIKDTYKMTHVTWLALRHSIDFSNRKTTE